MLDCLTPLQVRGGATAHGEFDDLVRVLEVELPRKWRAGLILRASPSFVEGNRRVFALNIGMRNLPNLPLDQLCPKCNSPMKSAFSTCFSLSFTVYFPIDKKCVGTL